MLTGYNTDVPFEGTTYHVQSEDRGLDNPIIDTLVYCGGQILHQYKSTYEDLVDGPELSDEALAKLTARLEDQHRDIVRRTRHGEFATDVPSLSDLVKVGELDEVLENMLDNDDQAESLELEWIPSEGAADLCGCLEVRDAKLKRPVGGALINARLVSQGSDPVTVLEAETGPEGQVKLNAFFPPGGVSAVVFRAERGPGGGRLRLPIKAGNEDGTEVQLTRVVDSVPAGSHAPGSSS